MDLTTYGHEALFRALRDVCPRWLALGGGGYDMDVVPRTWTLAFGVMSGQSFPDALPLKYQEKYGGRWLHDGQSNRTARVKGAVEAVVAAVKMQFDN
jgi:acetoin utilization protein AcuC